MHFIILLVQQLIMAAQPEAKTNPVSIPEAGNPDQAKSTEEPTKPSDNRPNAAPTSEEKN